MTLDEIKELVNHSQCMDLGFVDENGRPQIRRVFCTFHKGLGRHLISTNTSSMHVQTVLKRNDACLYFADDTTGVCFMGKAIAHFDKEYREMLWHEGDEKYYPGGVTDEDYCVLEFVAESGRYYRYDGIGDLTGEELEEYDKGAQYKDYCGRHAE